MPAPLSPPSASAPVRPTAAPAAALAVLSLAAGFGPAEEHLLRLCATLHRGAQPVQLAAVAGSSLATHAAGLLPVQPLPGPGLSRAPRTAWLLARWLRRQRIGALLVTRAADLPVAGAAKLLLRGRLRLLFHQQEPLRTAAPAGWWARQWRRPLDAWLAPLPGTAREVEARTGLEARQLWVVPPGLPARARPGVTAATPGQARRLLDLPTQAPLLGVADDGQNGFFALELLYRLRTELGTAAGLVIVGHPSAPPNAARWQQLRQQARALQLSQCVYLRPFHAPEAGGLLFPALDALLCPAPTDDYDPLLLTALAAGCPVVAADGASAADFPGLQHVYPAGDLTFCALQTRQVLQASRAARLPAPGPQLATYFSEAQESRLLTDILHYLAS